MWTCQKSIFLPKAKLRLLVKRKRAEQHLSISISIYIWLMVVLFCGVVWMDKLFKSWSIYFFFLLKPSPESDIQYEKKSLEYIASLPWMIRRENFRCVFCSDETFDQHEHYGEHYMNSKCLIMLSSHYLKYDVNVQEFYGIQMGKRMEFPQLKKWYFTISRKKSKFRNIFWSTPQKFFIEIPEDKKKSTI